MSLRKIGLVLLVVLVVLGIFLGGQYVGRRKARPVEWLSQDLGGKYVIDFDITCPSKDGKTPGKSLGKVQMDADLTNGKWRVVRNDPGKFPTCD